MIQVVHVLVSVFDVCSPDTGKTKSSGNSDTDRHT